MSIDVLTWLLKVVLKSANRSIYCANLLFSKCPNGMQSLHRVMNSNGNINGNSEKMFMLLFSCLFSKWTRVLEPLPNNTADLNEALFSMYISQNERHYMLQLFWHTWLPGRQENTNVNMRPRLKTFVFQPLGIGKWHQGAGFSFDALSIISPNIISQELFPPTHLQKECVWLKITRTANSASPLTHTLYIPFPSKWNERKIEACF